MLHSKVGIIYEKFPKRLTHSMLNNPWGIPSETESGKMDKIKSKQIMPPCHAIIELRQKNMFAVEYIRSKRRQKKKKKPWLQEA